MGDSSLSEELANAPEVLSRPIITELLSGSIESMVSGVDPKMFMVAMAGINKPGAGNPSGNMAMIRRLLES